MTSIPHTPIALVTGGGRGLGRSIALHLAKDGADVIVTYVNDREAAESTVAEVVSSGRRGAARRLDVGDAAGFSAFADALQNLLTGQFESDGFDYLVNNAGIGLFRSIAETSAADLDHLFAIHLKGPFLLTQALVTQLRDGGRVVNLSSGATHYAMPGMAAYAVMKGGVEALTVYLAKELGPRGITVNTVAPGPILSDFGDGLLRDDASLQAAIRSQTALGRIGEPDDVGGAVSALLRPGSRFVTAQRIDVSGGLGI